VRAVPALVAVLGSEQEDARRAAAWAIGSVEPDRAPRELIAALSDRSPKVRRVVAWALYNIEDPDAVPALEAALAREDERDLRMAYVRALAATGERSADALSRLLGSDDPEIRSIAVRSLAGSGGVGPWPMPWPRPRPNP
jgi:HEAT repeat protein